LPVLYNSVAIVPAPLVSVSQRHLSADDGTDLGYVYDIVLTGSIVAVPPGTSAISADARLGVLLSKQSALSDQFSTSGKKLEIYSPDGSGLVQCNPRVVGPIEFTSGIWVERTDYTITLESDRFYPSDELPAKFVEDVAETWSIEEDSISVTGGGSSAIPVWKVTHGVSAKGRLHYSDTGIANIPWQEARDFVLTRASVGFNSRPFDSSNELSLAAGSGYNHTRIEEIDILGGRFSLTETWILAQGVSAVEDYTASVKWSPEDTSSTVSVTITGAVRGLSILLNDSSDKIANALSYFNSSVKPNLVGRAQSFVPNVALSDYGVSGSADFNYAEGTISYSYDFSDRPTVTGNDTVYDNYTVSKKSGLDSPDINVTVSGTVTGRLRVGEPNASLLKYQRAKTYWDSIVGTTTLFNRAKQSGVNDLKSGVLDTSVDFDFSAGTITYTFEFTNRPDQLAINDYTLSLKSGTDTRTITANIEGTITGLRNLDTDPNTVRYANATSFWSSWEPQLFGKVTSFAVGATLNPTPNSKSRGDNPRGGTINYNYEFNTDAVSPVPNSLSYQVTVVDDKAADVFAVIPVLGRLAGPVLQDIHSKKEKAKSLTIEVVMKPSAARPNVDSVVATYRPSAPQVFVDSDSETWVTNEGVLTRNVRWIYE
jgi:hypothetical protein